MNVMAVIFVYNQLYFVVFLNSCQFVAGSCLAFTGTLYIYFIQFYHSIEKFWPYKNLIILQSLGRENN